MEADNRHFREPAERLSALLLAVAATFIVFAAINAGFTPHATDLAGRVLGQSALTL